MASSRIRGTMDSQAKSPENPQFDHNRFIAAGKCSSRLLKNADGGERCETFESRVGQRRIFRAPRAPILNQSCAAPPVQNEFQQPANAQSCPMESERALDSHVG